MALRELLKETDTLVEESKLIVPEMGEHPWTTPIDVHRFLGRFLMSNWSLLGRRAWEATDNYMNTLDRPISEFEKERKTSILVLVEGTGLHVSGSIVAESEKICRQRKERNDDGWSHIWEVGSVSFSVGDENEGLYATTCQPIEHGSGHPGHFRGISLYGTLPTEVPYDESPPFERSRSQAVAAFIQERFVTN